MFWVSVSRCNGSAEVNLQFELFGIVLGLAIYNQVIRLCLMAMATDVSYARSKAKRRSCGCSSGGLLSQ